MAINAPKIINPLTERKAKELYDRALSLFLVSDFYRKAPSKLSKDFNIKIVVSNRMFSCAGKASVARIKLNARLLGTVSDAIQYNTVSHELAHVIAFNLYRKSGHGTTWQLIHQAMGGTAERCHDMDVTGLCRRQPLHLIKRVHDGKLFKVKTRTANKVRRHPGYQYIGLVETTP